METQSKVGMSVISYDRPDYLRQSISSLEKNNWGGASYRLIVVDEPYDDAKYCWLADATTAEVIYKENGGVASAKNIAFELMLRMNCVHLFIIEDDILLVNNCTCQEYINYANICDVPHLNFALHGELNKGKRKFVNWDRLDGSSIEICVYPNCVGAFSYYTSNIIAQVGFMDTTFRNAWDHVEHTWRISLTGKIPPFWYFMDTPVSTHLLQEIPDSVAMSIIRNNPELNENISAGRSYWILKHGTFLTQRPAW